MIKKGESHGCFNIKYGTIIMHYLKSSAIKLEHKRYPTYAFNPNIPKEILEIL